MPPDDALALVTQIGETVATMKKDNAAILAELRKDTALAGKTSADALKAVEDLAQKMQGSANALIEMEQKLAQKVVEGKTPVDTLGQTVIKSDAWKNFASGKTNRCTVQANTITGQEGSPPANSGTIVAPDRLSGIVPGAFRLLRIKDALPQGNTTSNNVQYVRELAFTNNAAETAEAAQKPQSALTFELVNNPVVTIAHFIKVSKQVLDDAPMLASYIDVRLRYGADYRLDSQLLNGDGTGQNLHGMTMSGNYTDFTPVTGDTALDSINRAIYLVYAADYAPTAVIMNPADWGAIERLKDSQQRYIIGAPQSALSPVIWGLPVVVSNAMTAGKFLVGATDIAYQVWNRQGTTVELFTQDENNAQLNLVTVRAENRAALASYRPASVRYGNLTL